MFARFDAPHWKKWQFYPGALTVMLPRIIIGVLIAVISIIFVNILLIGQRKSEPIAHGCRKFLLRFVYKLFAKLQSFLSFWTLISYEYTQNTDYSEYLGHDSVENDKPVSVVVCNHTGFLEILALILSPIHPAFTPKAEHANSRLLGPLCRGLQCVFVQRGGPGGAIGLN